MKQICCWNVFSRIHRRGPLGHFLRYRHNMRPRYDEPTARKHRSQYIPAHACLLQRWACATSRQGRTHSAVVTAAMHHCPRVSHIHAIHLLVLHLDPHAAPPPPREPAPPFSSFCRHHQAPNLRSLTPKPSQGQEDETISRAQ